MAAQWRSSSRCVGCAMNPAYIVIGMRVFTGKLGAGEVVDDYWRDKDRFKVRLDSGSEYDFCSASLQAAPSPEYRAQAQWIEALDAHLSEGGLIGEPAARDLYRYCVRLEELVKALIENDPAELAADGGVTVLDVWRKDARAVLASGGAQ